MTLPTSGTIAISNFNTEAGLTSTASITLDWIRTNTKTGQQSNSFNGYYSKAWYQRNQDGNCNNANCSSAANCVGDLQCVNCTLATINCSNCDARSWFQNNCNCACTYNCSQTTNVKYNCNCDCACDCACGGDCGVCGV